MPRRVHAALLIAAYAATIYWLTSFQFSSLRWDFYFLADALLHGRLDVAYPPPGAIDTVTVGGRVYLPFAPFPAVLFMPLVALVGPLGLIPFEPLINSLLSALDVALCWVLLSRIGSLPHRTRLWLVMLFALSTPLWWITTRGGVWHTSQIVATGITLIGLLEVTGRRRWWVLGLVAATGFLTRAPLLFAVPLWAAAAYVGASPDHRRRQLARRAAPAFAVLAMAGLAIVVAFAYNAARFGSPLESGYGLAVLAPQLEGTREHGLFSLAYVPRNLDLLLTRLPVPAPPPLFLLPDGFGLSLFIASPGLLLALFADFRRRLFVACGLTAIAVLVPSLLYYGGGWYQVGFRYFLDSIPFVMVLVASGAARVFGPVWKLLIGIGILVGFYGFVFAYISTV